MLQNPNELQLGQEAYHIIKHDPWGSEESRKTEILEMIAALPPNVAFKAKKSTLVFEPDADLTDGEEGEDDNASVRSRLMSLLQSSADCLVGP